MLETVLEGLAGKWWLVGAVAVVGVVKGGRPLVKGAIKGYLAAQDGVKRLSTGSREGMHRLYEEARAEYQGAEARSEARAERRPRRSRTAAPAEA